MTERIVELFRSLFFLKDTFDRVSIVMCFVSKMHAELQKSGLEPRRPVNELFGVLDRMFLPKLSKKHRHADCSGQIEPDTKNYVRFWLDRRIEPEPFIVHLHDRLVKHDLVGISPFTRFEIRLLNPIMDDRLGSRYAEILKLQSLQVIIQRGANET